MVSCRGVWGCLPRNVWFPGLQVVHFNVFLGHFTPYKICSDLHWSQEWSWKLEKVWNLKILSPGYKNVYDSVQMEWEQVSTCLFPSHARHPYDLEILINSWWKCVSGRCGPQLIPLVWVGLWSSTNRVVFNICDIDIVFLWFTCTSIDLFFLLLFLLFLLFFFLFSCKRERIFIWFIVFLILN